MPCASRRVPFTTYSDTLPYITPSPGVDDRDSYDNLVRFVHTVSTRSPVTHFIMHARKAHLKGLNPHQNRTVPPLRYHWVWALKRDFPHLTFSLNGGVPDLEAVEAALRAPDSPLLGVMVGRAAYHAPWALLADADRRVFGAERNRAASRRAILGAYAKYADGVLHRWADRGAQDNGFKGPSLRTMMKPLLGLFAGEPRARQWRAAVDAAFKAGHTTVRGLVDATVSVLLPETLDEPPTERGPAANAAADAAALAAALEHWEAELPQTPAWFATLTQGAAPEGEEELLGELGPGALEKGLGVDARGSAAADATPLDDGSWVLVDQVEPETDSVGSPKQEATA